MKLHLTKNILYTISHKFLSYFSKHASLLWPLATWIRVNRIGFFVRKYEPEAIADPIVWHQPKKTGLYLQLFFCIDEPAFKNLVERKNKEELGILKTLHITILDTLEACSISCYCPFIVTISSVFNLGAINMYVLSH